MMTGASTSCLHVAACLVAELPSRNCLDESLSAGIPLARPQV